MPWALSPCTAMADSSAWSSRASCCGDTPSSPYEGYATISPWGNTIGAIIMVSLGFFPTWIACTIMNSMGLLRVPAKVELEGVDFALNHAFMESVQEVGRAEKAMIK